MAHNIIRTISKSGLCSRKQALDLVMAGEVKIKGKTILDPGTKVTVPGNVLINGKPLPKVKKKGCYTVRGRVLCVKIANFGD